MDNQPLLAAATLTAGGWVRRLQYSGGLSCCKSHNILLDKGQNPWPDNKLVYFMKYRFWFQDYVPATAVRGPTTWTTLPTRWP